MESEYWNIRIFIFIGFGIDWDYWDTLNRFNKLYFISFYANSMLLVSLRFPFLIVLNIGKLGYIRFLFERFFMRFLSPSKIFIYRQFGKIQI